MADYHTKRDSLTGFNRSRLRRQLQQRLGLSSNEQIFAGRGDCWTTTGPEQRREEQLRQRLQAHLREAKANETAFKSYLKARLEDPGPIPRPTWDKQAIARENKQRRDRQDTRKVYRTKAVAVVKRINQLAAYEQDLAHKQKNQTVRDSVHHKEYGHFTLEIVK